MQSERSKMISKLIAEKRYAEAAKLMNQTDENFWVNTYSAKSKTEKIKFWSGNILRQMRWNAEAGVDEMAVFSKQEYQYWKSREPFIDDLLPEILAILNVNKNQVKMLLEEE